MKVVNGYYFFIYYQTHINKWYTQWNIFCTQAIVNCRVISRFDAVIYRK